MFSKATANFVRHIDQNGSLIHVSRVNNSCKLVPMALVVKSNRIWFWQRPKYQPTNFTLSDLLLGDRELSPEVFETELVTYEGTVGDNICGKLETKVGSVCGTVEGRGTCKLQSCFGKLKKQELDVKKLLHDSSNRLVDMQHVLMQQLKKQAEVLAIVKERILTTESCSITQSKNEKYIFQAVFGLVGMLGSFVKCVQDSSHVEKNSNVLLKIPSDTVIAYSILELQIKKNGHYDICLQPGTIGGFEGDSPVMSCPSYDPFTDKVDGSACPVPASCAWKNGSQEVDLSPLAELPQLTRHALCKKLQETMKDRAALSYLQCVLEELCSGETLDTAEQEELLESQGKSLSGKMEQPNSDNHSECSHPADAAHLHAAHLLVSAMEELSDETLRLLSESRGDFLWALDKLMRSVRESSGPLSIQCLPVPLQDNQAFHLAEQLLSSTNVTLKRNTDSLWTEREDKAGVLPLLLCLSIHGLSLLFNGQK
ncbi:gasdermin-E-like [Hippoglossus hippoglossus]|uniref:gasdermin-E-like n=1 Tax=Hippoglossus hippoglossus TaxID=8267 RepID=UPI00148BB371|nr:gasdermin-E-like [Hippoglossus hippoglossus]XP_034457008.1 gasdermin-E-like [Hippoglossus hippoglossus]